MGTKKKRFIWKGANEVRGAEGGQLKNMKPCR